jgi:hypothetical protein
VGFAAVAIVAVWGVPPIPQDPGYHNFADRRTLLGIPNALDVLSNLGFLVAGILGVAVSVRAVFVREWERAAHVLLFIGVALTSMGSGWYHLAPGSARLFWDRLPMTIVFMSLFSVVIGERIHSRAGALLLGPLVAAGAGSVLFWHLGEQLGQGDLRFYALVQFLPLIAIPLMLLLFPAPYTRGGDVLICLGGYAAAKALEALDARIFALGGVVSGHTLKHLAAAAALLWLAQMVHRRRPLIEL